MFAKNLWTRVGIVNVWANLRKVFVKLQMFSKGCPKYPYFEHNDSFFICKFTLRLTGKFRFWWKTIIWSPSHHASWQKKIKYYLIILNMMLNCLPSTTHEFIYCNLLLLLIKLLVCICINFWRTSYYTITGQLNDFVLSTAQLNSSLIYDKLTRPATVKIKSVVRTHIITDQ